MNPVENREREATDAYHYARRFERARKNLEASMVDPKDKETILRFVRQLLLGGISKARATKYLLHLTVLTRNTHVSFEQFTRDDAEDLVGWINAQAYSCHTSHDYLVVLKKFFQWLRGSNATEYEYPEEVRWIKSNFRRKRLLPEALLSKDGSRTATTLWTS